MNCKTKQTMYKSREYIQIVTIDKEKNTVNFDEQKLNEQLTHTENTDLSTRKTNFIALVKKATEQLQVTLQTYGKSENKLLNELYSFPEKFQTKRAEFKKKLSDAQSELNTMLQQKEEKPDKELTKKIKLSKKGISKLSACLDQMKVDSSCIKNVSRTQFGIMTEKSFNNAIASWVVLYNSAVSDKKLAKKISEKKRLGKNCLLFWENKLNDISKSREDIPTDEQTKTILQGAQNKLSNSITEVETAIVKPGASAREVIKAVRKLRKDSAKIRKDLKKLKNPEVEKLALLKMSCDILDSTSHEQILERSAKYLESLSFFSKFYKIGSIVILLLGVIFIACFIAINVYVYASVFIVIVTYGPLSLLYYLLGKAMEKDIEKTKESPSEAVLLDNNQKN